MKERIIQFMRGRNGNDPLNRFLLVVGLLVILLGGLIGGKLGGALNMIALALIAVSWYRMLSRDLLRRQAENSAYLRRRYQVLGWFRRMKTRWDQRRDYRFFTCPSCHTTLRVPKGRGKIRIVCRKCGNSFTRKS